MGDLVEVLFEASGGHDLQYSARLVAGVPERMPLIPGLPYQLAGAGMEDFIAQQEAEAPSGYQGELILAAVHMQWCHKFSWSH